mmetsp:Transcript_9669/g.27238  ORF Transcript_9669/g.27238 Transcript_9669/m.27238 type:complete len:161 (-) Transcript_9669:210-692(-)
MTGPAGPPRSGPGRTLTWSEAANYLQGSRVGSAAGYVTVAGATYAIPHSARRARTPRTRFRGVSEAAASFRNCPQSHCSMKQKQLTPYNPNAQRSRLWVEDPPRPDTSSSSVAFGGGLQSDRHRFVTTHQSCFTGEPCDPRSSSAVRSASAKARRAMRDR